MSGGKPDLATVAALSSVLDRIDATNTAQPPRLKELSAAIHSPIPSTALEQTLSAEYIPPTSVVTATGTPVNVWLEYFDPASKRNYYHNLETKETTWDKPAIFVPASTAQSSSTRLSSGDEYRFAGAFNTQSGRFTAVKPHLFDASTGQAVDRSVRQLGHYVDLQELERNRETTKRKREEERYRGRAAPPSGDGSWREYNKEKKDEKRRKKLEALLHGA